MTSVEPHAASSGIATGDRIIAIDGVAVPEPGELAVAMLTNVAVDRRVALTVARGARTLDIAIVAQR